MATRKPENLDMFDLDIDKLSLETVEQREAIVRHYAENTDAIWFYSTSGGKDSDAGAVRLLELVKDPRRIVFIHANLGVVEHPGILDHIKRYIPKESEFYVVENPKKDFIDMVLLRGLFPSSQFRQCTSDLKVSQIDKIIKRVCRERGVKTCFNVTGLRSQESIPRSRRSPLVLNKRLTTKSRTCFDFLPVFHVREWAEEGSDELGVFDIIAQAGRQPFHIYGVENIDGKAVRVRDGNSRTSCRFCILGNKQDLTNAANWYGSIATNGEHTDYEMMVALEEVVNHSMFFKTRTTTETIDGKRIKNREVIKVSLAEKTGVPVDEVAVRRWSMILNERRQQLLEEKRIETEEKAAKKAEREAAKNAKFIDNKTIAMF